MSKYLIMLNGPPRSGKDTVSEYLTKIISDSEIIKFTKPVKDITHRNLSLNVNHDYYENLKDTKLPEFNGLTPRQAYIQTSERFREEQGQNAVSKLFVEAVGLSKSKLVINPDIGYDFELEAVLEDIPLENCLLIKVEREGHDFENDCREWIPDEKILCESRTLSNYNKENFLLEASKICEEFISSRELEFKVT